MHRNSSLTLLLVAVLGTAFSPVSATARADGSADENPPPPTSEPGLKRVRAVGLPGHETPREEKTGLPHKGLKGSVVDESGFGSVRKPDADPYITTAFPPRVVYLNGSNISSVRGETLENVQVRFDEEGNIHISAPHYEVSQDTSFHPLLPTELPRLPKARSRPLDLPEGRYSKDPARAPRAKGAGPRVRGARAPVPKVEVLEEGTFVEGPGDGGDAAQGAAGAGEASSDSRGGNAGGDTDGNGNEGGVGSARTLRVGDDSAAARAQEEGARGAKGVPAR